MARKVKARHTSLGTDNENSLAQLRWGCAGTSLGSTQRSLWRVAHRLCAGAAKPSALCKPSLCTAKLVSQYLRLSAQGRAQVAHPCSL